jgi:hypothetical protein
MKIFDHIGRLLLGGFILAIIYFFTKWLQLELVDKVFWLLVIATAYTFGFTIESFFNKKNKKKGWYD